MSHAIDNMTIKHDLAAKRLITKLILNPTLVGSKRNNERAKLIDTFMKEYGDFTNKRGMYAHENIWIMAADEHVKAYRCHYKYSLKFLKTGITNLVVPPVTVVLPTVTLLPITVIVPPIAVVVLHRRGPSPFVILGSQLEESDQTKAQWHRP